MLDGQCVVPSRICRQSRIEFTLPWAMANVSKISRHSAETDTYVSSGRLKGEWREGQLVDISDQKERPQ